MKAVLLREFIENYDDIRVSEVPEPTQRDGEVLVRVDAAGLNFVDLLYARGKHQNNRILVKPPLILGLEFSGTIISPSPSHPHLPLGTPVFGSHTGCFAEIISVNPTQLKPIPKNWSSLAAATLAATAPVAYGALIPSDTGNLMSGQAVLIHGAAGGLGLAAIQIAKAVGARVIATASTSEKLEICRKYGADECINYNANTEWWKTVLDLTGGGDGGVDVVFDSIGLVEKSVKCTKQRGRIIIVGFAGREGNMEKLAMNRILLKQVKVIGYRYGESSRRYPSEAQEIFKRTVELVEKGQIKPTVYQLADCSDRSPYMGLESVPRAMKDLASRKIWGKAVVVVNESGRDSTARL